MPSNKQNDRSTSESTFVWADDLSVFIEENSDFLVHHSFRIKEEDIVTESDVVSVGFSSVKNQNVTSSE